MAWMKRRFADRSAAELQNAEKNLARVEHGPTGWDRPGLRHTTGGDMSGIKKLFHDTKKRYSEWSKQSPELWHNKEYTRSHPTFGWKSSPNATWVQKDWMDKQARLGFPANLNELANVTDEYGRSRKYSHYPERIRKSWYDVTDEYGKGSPQYTDLLQQMDVDIYGKPESYPIDKPKSRMEMLTQPESKWYSLLDDYTSEPGRPRSRHTPAGKDWSRSWGEIFRDIVGLRREGDRLFNRGGIASLIR